MAECAKPDQIQLDEGKYLLVSFLTLHCPRDLNITLNLLPKDLLTNLRSWEVMVNGHFKWTWAGYIIMVKHNSLTKWTTNWILIKGKLKKGWEMTG